jgi:hypothetical protein
MYFKACLWPSIKYNAHSFNFHVTIFQPQNKGGEFIILWIFKFGRYIESSHLIYGLLTNTYGDLTHKNRQQNLFPNFTKVKLKQQMVLPHEALCQNMVLNVFNCKSIFVSFDPIIRIGITYPNILASLSIGLVVDYPPSLIFVHNEFPQRFCRMSQL